MMGLEEHLLGMFREDFEFHEGAAASHLSHAGGAAHATGPAAVPEVNAQAEVAQASPSAQVSQVPQVPEVPLKADSIAIAPGTLQVTPKPTHATAETSGPAAWSADAQKELQKIPFFVRGKARRNTERFAAERGVSTITVETLYDAKAHFGR